MNPAFRAGPPTPGVSRGPNLRCDRCRQTPTDPLQQILMSAVWLIPGPDGPTTARYCRACPPTGPITDLTCQHCGHGPLLVGDLAAAPDEILPEPTRAWLTAADWHLDEPICPDCRPIQHPDLATDRPLTARTRVQHDREPTRSCRVFTPGRGRRRSSRVITTCVTDKCGQNSSILIMTLISECGTLAACFGLTNHRRLPAVRSSDEASEPR